VDARREPLYRINVNFHTDCQIIGQECATITHEAEDGAWSCSGTWTLQESGIQQMDFQSPFCSAEEANGIPCYSVRETNMNGCSSSNAEVSMCNETGQLYYIWGWASFSALVRVPQEPQYPLPSLGQCQATPYGLSTGAASEKSCAGNCFTCGDGLLETSCIPGAPGLDTEASCDCGCVDGTIESCVARCPINPEEANAACVGGCVAACLS